MLKQWLFKLSGSDIHFYAVIIGAGPIGLLTAQAFKAAALLKVKDPPMI